jgi:hypothetical protein
LEALAEAAQAVVAQEGSGEHATGCQPTTNNSYKFYLVFTGTASHTEVPFTAWIFTGIPVILMDEPFTFSRFMGIPDEPTDDPFTSLRLMGSEP